MNFESLVLFITTSFKNFTARQQNKRDHDSVIIDVSAALIDLCTITAVLGATVWLHLYIARSKSTTSEVITDDTEQPEADKEQAAADRHGDEPKQADDIAVRRDSSLIWLVCGILFALAMLHKLVASRMDFEETFECFPTGLLRSMLMVLSVIGFLINREMKATPIVNDVHGISDDAACKTSTMAVQDLLVYAQGYLTLRNWAGWMAHFVLILLAAGSEPQGIAKALAYTSRFGLIVINVAAVFLGIAKLLRSTWFETTAHTIGTKVKAVAAELRQTTIRFAVWCRQHPAWGLGLVILIMAAASALYVSFEHTQEPSLAPSDIAIEQSVDLFDPAEEMEKIMQELLEHVDRRKQRMETSRHALEDMYWSRFLNLLPGVFL